MQNVKTTFLDLPPVGDGGEAAAVGDGDGTENGAAVNAATAAATVMAIIVAKVVA